MAWQLYDSSGDPEQYCYETLYLGDLSGGDPDPCPHLDLRMRAIARHVLRCHKLIMPHLTIVHI